MLSLKKGLEWFHVLCSTSFLSKVMYINDMYSPMHVSYNYTDALHFLKKLNWFHYLMFYTTILVLILSANDKKNNPQN